MTPNERAFLDMIAISEGTAHLGERGYNVLVGGTLFHGYDRHPCTVVRLKRIGKPDILSSAAGRYQILKGTWAELQKALQLPDFSPESQDRAALQLIKRRKALDDVRAGRITQALEKCRQEWASLPGAGYGQHENRADRLIAAYKQAGGAIT